MQGQGAAQIQLTTESANVIQNAIDIAERASDSFVTTERLLQSLASTESAACKILNNAKVTAPKLHKIIEAMRMGRKAESENSEGNFNAVARYAKDLTEIAKLGKLDPFIKKNYLYQIKRAKPTCQSRI